MRFSDIEAASARQDAVWASIQRLKARHEKMLCLAERHSRQKAIQDPVYGAIILAPWELDIVSTWEVLRLRHIKQLGPAHIVYPGATHTRFEHSLGTNYLAQKCIAVVSYCDDLAHPCFRPISELMDGYHQRVFRAAALLHDVGHPPTSHTIEPALESWCGLDHTDIGEYLILKSDLVDVLEKNDIDPNAVVGVLKRRTQDPLLSLISDFLDSPLDIDKTDYLIRDAHFSGVQLGVFPAERVLLTNRVVLDSAGQWVRAFMLKALHSLESLILSRNWMFSDLYLHHAVRVAEAMTCKATYSRIKETQLSREECIGLFTRMTDDDLYRWLESSEIDFVSDYAARIRYRRLFKVVVSRPKGMFSQDTWNEILRLSEDLERLSEVETELSGDIGGAVIDVLDPEVGDKGIGSIPLLVGSESSGYLLRELRELREGNPLIATLRQQKKTIPCIRVYSDPVNAEQVRRRFDEVFRTDVDVTGSDPQF